MKALRDVSLQSLFVEIEARHGKKEAEYLGNIIKVFLAHIMRLLYWKKQ